MMRVLNILAIVGVAAILTILTQVGGLVWIVALVSSGWLKRRIQSPWKLRLAKTGYFTGLYLLATVLIVPLLAPLAGRVPLPILGNAALRPLRPFTWLLNRHYVRPELRDAAMAVADQMADRFPGTTLHYLDANFPFIDGFPLIPHLSHGDGRKLDLAFCYTDPSTGDMRNGSPSWLGYGAYAAPLPMERDQPAICAAQGQWQYSIMQAFVPSWSQGSHALDPTRTRAMVDLFAAQSSIHKIFIEPHLQARLHLQSPKIRYHGCQAARHDDHVHVQL